MTYMFILKCALKLVEEIIQYLPQLLINDNLLKSLRTRRFYVIDHSSIKQRTLPLKKESQIRERLTFMNSEQNRSL